ncbi:DNA topoisomerase IB [Nocardia thailandica]
MRLRRVRPYGPGIERVRRGRGFGYRTTDGDRVDDPATLARIEALVIPPAWREVWISDHPHGHIQAVGVDAAGRKQYLYHEQWRRERDEEKFDRVLELATHLPAARRRVRADLARDGLGKLRICAAAITLLDRGVFRVGGEEYAEENGSRGVATLLREQVRVSGDTLCLDFPAKGGIRRQARVTDPALVTVVRALRRVRPESGRLLVYRERGGLCDLTADDVNQRFKELTGCEGSVKDLRTWEATVLAAECFAEREPAPESERRRRAVIKEVMTEVAERLGNTPTVARDAYVDPRVVTAFTEGRTIAAALRRADRCRSAERRRDAVEKAVLRLLAG